jgi:hypothetical protein
MPRSIQQTGIHSALASLKQGLEGLNTAFAQLEAYYRAGAEIDLNTHPGSGVEVLNGILQRLDGVAQTLRRDSIASVERLWRATEEELQAAQRDQQNRSAAKERDGRNRRGDERAAAAAASRAQELDEQRQVNRLLWDRE